MPIEFSDRQRTTIAAAITILSAVVILFAVGTLTKLVAAKRKEDIPNSVCGMVSNIGGLVMVEHAVDMKFIGYWRKDCQPYRDFLEDHELEIPPDHEDEDDEEGYEDEAELNR